MNGSMKRRAPRWRGFTLIEVLLYATITVMLSAPVVSVLLVSTQATKDADSFCKAQERNRFCMLQIETDLRECLGTSVIVQNSETQLLFTTSSGFDGTSVTSGPQVRYTLQLDSTESANAVDDDGDGLVDEGVLVRRDVTAGTEGVICGAVDLGASSFSTAGSSVTITLISLGRVDRSSTPFSVARTVTVFPRN